MSSANGTISANELWGIDGDYASENKNDIPAFFNIEDHDNDEQIKEWMDTAIGVLQSQATEFSRKAVENLMFYKGLQHDAPQPHYRSLSEAQRFVKTNKISLNIVYEFVELQVNRAAQFKPNIVVSPTNNDTSARDAAEAKGLALKDYFNKNNINHKMDVYSRECYTLGESFFHVWWNPDAGDVHPEYRNLRSKFKELQRVDTPSGDAVNIDRKPRIGDVVIDVVPAIHVLYEERPWEQVEYVILNIPANADKLRSEFPKEEINGSGDIDCYWMYHLPTRYLQKGRFVKYAGGAVLENTVFPLAKPVLPVIKMTDIDIIGAARGKSFVENIKPHQVLINETISSTWNNLRRSAKGKWVMPARSVNPKHLSPDSPGIEYLGGVPPKFVAYPGIKPEAISFIELLREYAEKQARIHGVTQGTPPPNVRSGLQFAQLEEQQRKSVEIMIAKRNRAIEELGEVVMAYMSKFYKAEDGRTVTVFGKDKEYLTESLKVDVLKEDHAIKVENNDTLPTGKASQMAFYSDIRNSFGNQVVPDEMMIDMLDSGRFNQYSEFGGATVETTMAQISKILAGGGAGDVYEYEDLPLKWKLVVGHMRKRAFVDYSKEIKEEFKALLLGIETMLMNKEQGPLLQQQIQSLSGFPVYWTTPQEQYADGAQATAPAVVADPAAAQGGGVAGVAPSQEELAQLQALSANGEVAV